MSGVADHAERTLLITARARIDPAFPESVFVSLRRYQLSNGREPGEAIEVAAVDDALMILGRWLEEFTNSRSA